MLLINFLHIKLNYLVKRSEQIAFNTRPEIRENILVVMDESVLEEHLSQPLQANNRNLKVTVIFLICYNGIFNVTNSKNRFYFMKSISDEDGFIQISISAGAYERESLNKGIKRFIIDDEHYAEAKYPLTIKPNFSTLGSII